jgi:hypothetical protein
MTSMKKTVIIAILIFLVLTSICWVWAAKGPVSISVTYNNLKIVVDGSQLQTTNEPFIMKNGKIFASIEDIAKALDKPTKYDTKSATLYVGKLPSKSWCYLSDLEPVQWDGEFERNPGEKGLPFSIAGKKYVKGFSTMSSTIEYNLAGEYSQLTGQLGIDDRDRGSDLTGEFYIYVDDTLVYYAKEVKVGDFPKSFDIDVTNGIRLKIKAINSNNRWGLTFNWVNLILTR